MIKETLLERRGPKVGMLRTRKVLQRDGTGPGF